ncbi:MAG: O-antigen ligase C-terminal domain-containing protein [Ramlibacter sp.]|nr:O-antigen ligase C-terminal domain-containing protein [Ramlibacter sp.]
MALPWLIAVAPGPSPGVVPWLVSVGCAALLGALARPGQGSLAGACWRDLIATAWLSAAVISSAIALLQYFGWAHYFTPLVNASEPGLAFGNLRQRNQLATLTMIGLVAALWRASKGLAGWRLYGAVLVLAIANASTVSRTGLLQLALVTFLSLSWWRSAKPLRLCAVAWGFYVVASLGLPLLLRTLSDADAAHVWWRLSASTGCSSRMILWSNVLHLIGEKPWLGWGWGELDYAHYYTLYQGPRFCEILDNAHNLPLHLAVELGIPVAAAACCAFIWLLWRGAPWRETDPMRQMAWAVLALILFHSLVEYPLWYGPFQMAVGLAMVILWRVSARVPSGIPWQMPATLRLGIAGVVLAGVAYASWDYYRVCQIYLPQAQRSAAFRDNTLEKIGDSLLFGSQVRFAELTTTPLTRANAEHLGSLALDLLHFSPEPRVIEILVESLVLQRRDDEALAHMMRFRAAFPREYASWTRRYADSSPSPLPGIRAP